MTSFPILLSRNKVLQRLVGRMELGEACKKVLPLIVSNLDNEPRIKAAHLKFANFNLETYHSAP